MFRSMFWWCGSALSYVLWHLFPPKFKFCLRSLAQMKLTCSFSALYIFHLGTMFLNEICRLKKSKQCEQAGTKTRTSDLQDGHSLRNFSLSWHYPQKHTMKNHWTQQDSSWKVGGQVRKLCKSQQPFRRAKRPTNQPEHHLNEDSEHPSKGGVNLTCLLGGG